MKRFFIHLLLLTYIITIGFNTQDKPDKKLQEICQTILANLHQKNQDKKTQSIIFIDLTKPSTVKRLWILNSQTLEIIHHDYVAHGRHSGLINATSFSNRSGSNMSSEGVYQIGAFYHGKHGISIQLNGLEKNFNDNALNRKIVIHEAYYVSPSFISKHGHLGRSLGCPAVSAKTMEFIKKTIHPGDVLVIYTENTGWIKLSNYLKHSG